MKRSVGFWLMTMLGATVALVFFMEHLFPGTLDDPDTRMSLIYKIGWIALIGSSVIGFTRANPKGALRNVLIWVVIFLVLVGGYSFKNDLGMIGQRIASVAVPSQGTIESDGAVSFVASEDGHYYIQAAVNGSRVTFLVDTGASDIVLTPKDARRIGLDPDALTFDQAAETANGTVMGASVRLDSFVVGPITLRDVPASVNAADISESLLGMAFLNRLHGWRVEDGKLTLIP